MFSQIDDTIVAISSPMGASARGVIRLSGSRALSIVSQTLDRADYPTLSATPGHRRLQVRVQVAASSLPAELYLFRSPSSYTRQDLVELHLVGSPPLLALLLDQMVTAGARIADPGEFTARAFFSGSLDLTRVEGVAAAIAARTDAQLRASQHLLHGGFGRRISDFREELTDLLALVEAEIDFVDESISFVTPAALQEKIEAVLNDINRLLESGDSCERLAWLPEIVLLGPPNAGKSTLFNRLTGTDRAIQSAVAGTTRDVLRFPLALPGGEIMLCDSAGVDALEEQSLAQSEIETMASKATWQAARTADHVLLVLDAADDSQDIHERLRTEFAPGRCTILLNKADLLSEAQRKLLHTLEAESLLVSGLTGEGVQFLINRLNLRIFSQSMHRAGDVLALTSRQTASLEEARGALYQTIEMLTRAPQLNECAELIAMEIREAVSALSLLTGEVTTEDLLGRIFSRFCIGK